MILSNAFTPTGVDDIGLHLLDPKVPLADPAPPEPPERHTESAIDPLLLAGYTGRYRVNANLILEITCDGGRLFAQGFAQAAGQAIVLPKFELFAESRTKFFAKVSDTAITFDGGTGGPAPGLILRKSGRDMPAARLP